MWHKRIECDGNRVQVIAEQPGVCPTRRAADLLIKTFADISIRTHLSKPSAATVNSSWA